MRTLLFKNLPRFQKMRRLTSQSQYRSQAKFSNCMKKRRVLICCLKIESVSELIFINSWQNEPKSTCLLQNVGKVTLFFHACPKVKLGVDKSSHMRILLFHLKAKHRVWNLQKILTVLHLTSLKLRLIKERKRKSDF
jgi:hypothetical protein